MDPLHYFSLQPVFHDWCNKGCSVCYPVCGVVQIKYPLLLNGKNSPYSRGRGFPLLFSSQSVCLSLSYFLFQPVLHDLCNKGCGMCYPVCGMLRIKEPLLLIGKRSLYSGGSRFSLLLNIHSFIYSLLAVHTFPYVKNRFSWKIIGKSSLYSGGSGFSLPLNIHSLIYSLLAVHTFPYVKKRILVKDTKEIVLQPIEVAIDEIQKKVADIHELLSATEPGLIKLQLALSGSVATQVMGS